MSRYITKYMNLEMLKHLHFGTEGVCHRLGPGCFLQLAIDASALYILVPHAENKKNANRLCTLNGVFSATHPTKSHMHNRNSGG